jgi:very-short-patch-repair endonuclease
MFSVAFVGANKIMAKIRLADLVEADERHLLRESNFDSIKSRHIDFVICDPALSSLIAVELDDSSHRLRHRQARDRDLNRILEIASLPILRVTVCRAYDAAEIKRQLLATLHPSG